MEQNYLSGSDSSQINAFDIQHHQKLKEKGLTFMQGAHSEKNAEYLFSNAVAQQGVPATPIFPALTLLPYFDCHDSNYRKSQCRMKELLIITISNFRKQF